MQNEVAERDWQPADEEPPKDFDWDAWQGPAPAKHYNKNRRFIASAGSTITPAGNSPTSACITSRRSTGLGLEARCRDRDRREVANYDNREVPDTMEVLWHYPGDTMVAFSQYNASGAPAAARGCEIEFRGTKGTLYLSSNGYEVVPESITPNEFAARDPSNREKEKGWRTGAKPQIEAKKVSGKILDADHARNFLDCVKSRKEPSCSIEFGHRATTAPLIANIAHRTKSYLEWDAKAERFTNSEAANKMLSYEYRKPYRLPG